MSGLQPATYTVEAYNVSHASENKIHDDSVAKKLGFTGGLVPGVEVFAYSTHPVVARYGRAWLQRGKMEARFVKPLYDGHMATVTAVDAGDGLDLALESEGVRCATGHASMPGSASLPPALDGYARHLPPGIRPPTSRAWLLERHSEASRTSSRKHACTST